MWIILLSCAVIFLILEITMPAFFFLNFAIAALICSVVAYFTTGVVFIVCLFFVLSLLLLFVLRPVLLGFQNKNCQKTGMEEKYVGKTATVVEDVDKNKGIITLYDERWQARNVNEDVILKGETVEIVGYESIIMKVKKV